MATNSTRRMLDSAVRRHSLLLKTVGYRVLSVIVTVLIAFVVLGDTSAALDIGIGANVVKMGVYYAYERAWSNGDLAALRRSFQ